MNKSKIEYVDYTWNPVTGCLHGCEYCYARRIANRFAGKWTSDYGECLMEHGYPELTEQQTRIVNGKEMKIAWPFGFMPTFHRYRLDEPQKIKKPQKIFVCSMADLFGDWVPDEWIEKVIQVAKECAWHKFLFLTKNPRRYYAFEFPENCWLGASAVNKPDEKVIEVDGGYIVTTAHCVVDTMTFFKHSFISFEPLLNDVMQDCDIDGIEWIIVGAQTGPGAKPPKPEWVQSIIDQARAAEVPIFLKNNLHWSEKIQEFPEGL